MDRATKTYVVVDIAKLEISINVTICQLCVSVEFMWNVTEYWTEGINGKMPLIKQLQNTVNYQFLYDFIKDWWSKNGNPVGANRSIPEHTGSNPTQPEK